MKAALKDESPEGTASGVRPEASKEDVGLHIANLLVQNGDIEAEQLEYAKRIWSKLKSTKTLVSVILELRLITEEKLQSTLRANPLSIPLGALLVELGYLRDSDLRTALALQSDDPKRKLGEILIEAHLLKEEDLVKALSYQFGIECQHPAKATPEAALFRAAPVAWFRGKNCIPLMRRDGAVVVAFADPSNQRQIDLVSRLYDNKIVIAVAGKDEIHRALNRAENATGKRASVPTSENTIIQTANELITAAADTGVSDIHLEPAKQCLRVRYRKDGVLITHKEFPTDIIGPLINRFKIMSKIDISEKRRHQDGRLLFDHHGNPLDIRVSTYGSTFGETIVMRLLNNREQLLDIREIGMAATVATRYVEDALEAPSGVIMVTGPTGSGKTTTLYASVQYLNRVETSIITAEDPVEYVIDGITQCSINPKINVTYEDTLKHIVRQDPDVIVIGEIRDKFSADTAVQAALTGHKVLTTFHTEDSIGGLLRLLNMNVEAFLISSTVISVVAQRLVRRICPHCAEDEPLSPSQIRRLGYEPRDYSGLTFKIGRGCRHCSFRGYSGRLPVFELLVLNEMVKDAIIARKTSYEIRRISTESSGLVTLLEDAIFKASEGLTSYDEIIRQIPRLSKPRPLKVIQQKLREE
jgi:type IV pilus assembly protein PilB